ncbi:MAG: TonB-dependent receptor [Candidatus Aminicenantes bacterium]|nr:TonB-dependent receptor [Candidatus Aminicenantes bacterium]
MPEAILLKQAFISILLLFSFLQPGFPISSEVIKGRVCDDEGKPLANVKVTVRNFIFFTQTGKDGVFVLKNPRKKEFDLIFSHPDYMSQTVTVVSGNQSSAHLIEVCLKAKNPILRTIKEEITVTAEADSIIDINLPSHRTILPNSVLTEMGSSNIAESMTKVPGLTAVGKGGYSMVPSIRGLAEHRILLLMDGVRITSERRIGASASFISLGDIDRIEINRGPYSVFHGSGAVGGIINIITQSPSAYSPLKGNFSLSYNTARKERAANALISGSLGQWGLMVGANGKKADDYSAPAGTVEWSRYSDYNLLFKLNRQSEKSEFFATFLHYKGADIGKPSPTSFLKPRWYPEETNALFTIGYNRKNVAFLDNLNTSLYVLHSVLETQGDNLRDEDLILSKRNIARVQGTNFGFKVRGGKSLGVRHTLNFGFDFFGQTNVNDQNTDSRFDDTGRITQQITETSLKDAGRSSFGFYIDDKILISDSVQLNAGGRFDTIATSNVEMDGQRISQEDEFISIYAGSIVHLTPKLSLLANMGRAFRFPTISELFYTGLTGRGTVFGNPDLKPETAFNSDIGLRYLHEKFFASVYGFHNSINRMIEKYGSIEDEEYFYRNLTHGHVTGIEGEFYIDLQENLGFFLNFHHMVGKEEKTDAALNYIPPTRLTLWGKYSPGRFWAEPQITFSWAKNDPGPLEVATDAYVLLDIIFGFKVDHNLTFLAVTQNILDQTYRASADESGVDAPGRGFVVKMKYSF